MPDHQSVDQLQVCVLAAGFSRRFGRAKLLEKMADGRRLIDHSLQAYLELNLPLVVFLREDDHDLRSHLSAQNIAFNLLGDVREGLSVTVRAAASFCLSGQHPFTLFALADMPSLDAEALKAFLKKIIWRDDVIAAPYSEKEGRLGNPVVFARRFLPEFQKLKGDQGARPVIQSQLDMLQAIDSPHPGFYQDVDKPEDLIRSLD
ncbi:nucleotidyltransferase family protein [Pseudoteredinibacter isoporae]|uniref:nucleotidyltransferase family protein n=1 Tax=Pseudoteredinibacter isoporae TaxID=570281 RepID=UPI0031096438